MSNLIANGKGYVNLPPLGFKDPIWLWFLWNIWKARNKLWFENKLFTEWEVVTKSVADSKEWAATQSLTTGRGHTAERSSSAPPSIP